MKKIITLIVLFLTLNIFSQEKLSLSECYSLVNKNYPLVKQNDLLIAKNKYDLAVLKTAKLPQFDFTTQATYQSDVTSVPIIIPGSSIDPPNKDQYKATISFNQLVFDGGRIKALEKVTETDLKVSQQKVAVNLYQLKQQINQLYFSILLAQENNDLLKAKQELLVSKLREVKASIKYGVLLPTSANILQAELLKIKQQFSELKAKKSNLIETLSSLTGTTISKDVILKSPIEITINSNQISRPELQLFKLEKDKIIDSENALKKQNSPKLVAFGTGGYGSPGLNMLDNSFKSFYYTGLKLSWPVFDWHSSKKQRKSLKINEDIIDTEKEVFELSTKIQLDTQQQEINKQRKLLQSDKDIIELHQTILKVTESQFKNGVITASEYVTQLTNLFEAKNNLAMHTIQLQLAKSNYNTIKGN
jgi:outer membrane protein TolC